MWIGNREFKIGERTYIMGILNVTPDSFSDGGRYNNDTAVCHAMDMIKNGADIIDVGGESTRPAYRAVNALEEIERVEPIIRAIHERNDTPISIDTYKAVTAERAIIAGADLVNDVWGLKRDTAMARVISEHKVACCIMHNRENNEYKDLIADVIGDLKNSIDIALSAGVSEDKIIVDPGIGFAKNYEQNIAVMRELERISEIGYPVLLGASRKSMIGLTLDTDVNNRLEGTIATSVIAIMKKCEFVRVHDVSENRRAIIMADKIIRGER